MKRPDIDAIKARESAATKGPWVKDGNGTGGHIKSMPDPPVIDPRGWEETPTVCLYDVWSRLGDHEKAAQENFDGSFIASARQDIPDLIAYIEHLEARLAAQEPGGIAEYIGTIPVAQGQADPKEVLDGVERSMMELKPQPDYTSETEDLTTWPQTRGKEWREMRLDEMMREGDVGWNYMTGAYEYAYAWVGCFVGVDVTSKEAWTRRPPQTKGEG